MATYKVLQDIEAEDHLLGPLTLRQFIYGCVAAMCAYFCFLGLNRHAYFLIVVFGPFMLLSGFFAFPWRRDQPTEIWALAMVRFMLIPRKRIWNQAGQKELVKVIAPKKVERNYTDGLSQTEVKSRLKALADTIDTRGWATRNILPADAVNFAGYATGSDRLVELASQPDEVTDYGQLPDVMDESSATSENFQRIINSSEQNRRSRLVAEMKKAASTAPAQPASPSANPDNFWFLNQSGVSQPNLETDPNLIAPGTKSTSAEISDDFDLSAELRASRKKNFTSHMKVIPSSAEKPAAPEAPERVDTSFNRDYGLKPPEPINYAPNDVKIEESRQAVEQAALASNNNMTVDTSERQAKPLDDGEVEISLH